MRNYLSLTTEEKKALARTELIRINKLNGKTPTKEDFKAVNDTKITYGQIVYLYKKWNLAIKDAGLKSNKNRMPNSESITKREIVDAFIDAANREKKMPTFKEFKKHHDISLSPFLKIFGSWNLVKQYIYTKHREQLTFLPERITAKRNRRTKAEILAARKKQPQ
ncbi:MAG: hypothetical protein RBR35_07475 [Salinivirgaceae bacterium]|nr:hypothetical protein [Salinivirgaceae bacterium]MDY0280385.1 hypothetical protein [Salinivirgaceae bacterium]